MTTEPIQPAGRLEITDEMRSSYLDYAMSVIVARALPDVRDGLKPVQRRILYAMHDQGMRPTAAYKKSARLVGEVLGKYHPHGDAPVYEAMVRMVQDFAMHHPLVDGQGNYGSMDGDPPAAMRYTECRMAPIASAMLEDIERDTVDWSDNFDQSTKEPTILPARLPNLLLNGASGIAVGLATNIPPHNLIELCDAIEHLAHHPDADIDELMQFVRGPDFPTGAYIRGAAGIRDGYTTGRGRIILEAKHHEEELKRGGDRTQIVVTELPYQVNKAMLIVNIAAMINKRKLEGASSVRDESDRKGLRIVIELRRGASPQVVMNNLYKHTRLRTSYNFNVIALLGGMPQVLTLKQALWNYIEFRREVVRRRSEFELRKAKARLHILEGLRIAINDVEAVVDAIRKSADVESARGTLMARFGMSELQAQAVLEMQLRRIAALEREKIEAEYASLEVSIAELQELLATPAKVTEVICGEIAEIKQKHGRPRRTEISQEELGEWRREDVEPHKEVVITLSKSGYIKRVDSTTYRAQHRGGKGIKGQRMSKSDDVTSWLQVADTHDHLMMFTNQGRVFKMRVFELQADQSRTARGTPVINLVDKLRPREQVHSILTVSNMLEDVYLTMATKLGRIKRMHLARFRNINRQGLICFHMEPKDELVSVKLAAIEQDIMIVSKNGMAIRFPSEKVRPRTRRSGGRRGMTLSAGDEVVAMDVVGQDAELLVVTQLGFGKISALEKYRIQNPGGKGLMTLRIAKKNGTVASAATIIPEIRQDSEGRLFLLTERAQVLRTNLNEIRSTGRVTMGVTLVKPDQGDRISSIQVISKRHESARKLNEEELQEIEKTREDQNGDAAPEVTEDAEGTEGMEGTEGADQDE